MPTKEQHLTQAARNEALADVLLRTEYGEWTVTVYFYAAVHYIEAFLAVQGIHCDGHTERNTYVGRIPELRRVGKEYSALRTVSRQARYHALPISPDDVSRAQQNLTTVKTQIEYVLTGKKH